MSREKDREKERERERMEILFGALYLWEQKGDGMELLVEITLCSSFCKQNK